ncbi:MAG: hypothetical protein ACMV1D_11990 [Macromonas sp.]
MPINPRWIQAQSDFERPLLVLVPTYCPAPEKRPRAALVAFARYATPVRNKLHQHATLVRSCQQSVNKRSTVALVPTHCPAKEKRPRARLVASLVPTGCEPEET